MSIKKIILILSTVMFLNIANASENSDVVLQRSGGGSIPLASMPDPSNIKFICTAISGTKAKVISKKDNFGVRWYEVQALNGECQDKKGWVSFEHIQNG